MGQAYGQKQLRAFHMLFPFGRKAKLQKLLKELQNDIVGEALKFSEAVQSRHEEMLGRQVSQMVLTMGALVFLVYVLGRYAARYSERLMSITFDPTVSDISRLFGKMIGAFKSEDATLSEAAWLNMLNLRSAEYSEAPWAREGAHDKSSLFTIAACGISADVDQGDNPLIKTLIENGLMNAVINLNFGPRLKSMAELL